LTYSGEVDPEETRDQPIPPDATSLIIVSEHKLQGAIGYVCASVTGTDRPSPRVAYEKKDGEVVLDLREPALLHVKISAGGENSCQSETIWDDSVVVAQLGTPYSLPLPPPTTFGKRALAATFSESGALTLAQFTSNTGVGQGLNVVNSALAATKGTTAAEKAAELKAEADVIAQTQRLAQCLADPKSCK